MLTPAEEDRLEAVFPTDLTVEYDGVSRTYELTPYWSGHDVDGDDATQTPEYPALAFDWGDRDVPNEDEQPANHLQRFESPEEETYVETRVRQLYSDLAIQVAVRRRHDGIPPDVRLTELANAIWDVCDQDLDQGAVLNEEGESGERPMRVDLLEGVATNAQGRTHRAQRSIRIYYRAEHDVEFDTVDEIEYEVDVA